MRRALLAGVAALSVLSAPVAHTTEIYCVVVLKPPPEVSRDKEYNPAGWLALREKPNRKSKIIMLLHEGDYLIAGTEQCWEEVCDTDKREWTHIAGVPRIDGSDKQLKDKCGVIRDTPECRPRITFGWVRSKYIRVIRGFLCPEDQELEAKRPVENPPYQNPLPPVTPAIPDPSKARMRLTVFGPKVISEQHPPKPTSTEPSKTANANPINLPSAMIGGWCYNKGTEAREVYIRNDGICVGTEGVLTIWPDSYGGSGGTCTLNKIDKLAMNGYLVKSSCKGLPKGQYDGLTWTENVELRITNGHLTVISVP
jgi:hypothetical protein